jgi:hypothetical protein
VLLKVRQEDEAMSIMIRDISNIFAQMSGMPISSKGGKNMLKQAGINIDSKQYQAVMKQMGASAGGGVVYTNPQAIKNLMKSYDEDGDYISPSSGLAGLTVTEKNVAQKNRIISISESSKQEMYELTKKEFLSNNGLQNGDTTKRGDVYTNLYKQTSKNERLAAGNTLQQYESTYRQAFIEAAKAADPEWELGKPVKSGALDDITRESVESQLTQSGNTIGKSSIDYKI